MVYDFGGVQKPSGDSYEPIRPKGVSLRLIPLLVLCLVLLFAYGLFSYLRKAEPFLKAEAFVRGNGEIRSVIGDIEECLPWLPTTIEWKDNRLELNMTLRVTGRMGTGYAKTRLFYGAGSWRLISVTFVEPRGATRVLIQEEKGPAKNVPGYEMLTAGHRRYRAKDFSGAVEEYSRAIVANPSLEAAYFWRGRAYVKKNDLPAAGNDFRKVLEINPRNVEAWNWLGWLSSKEGKHDDCIAYLSRAVELRPDGSWSYYYRGRCYSQKGETAKARDDAEKACRLGLKEACRMLQGGKP